MRRREFMSTVGNIALGVGVLSLGFDLGCGVSAIVKHAAQTGELRPNAWLTVHQDGRVVIQIEKAEIGQGVTTLYTTLVAEDLDVPIDAVEARYADALPEYRSLLGLQFTGASASTREAYTTIRRAAATAREMLATAAAAVWQVPRAECRTENGFVLHGSKRLAYGELTVDAASHPVPSHPRVKPRSELRLIGKHDRRVEARPKVDGTAKFGIDVVVPGMVRAWVLPRAVPGVIDIFAFPSFRCSFGAPWERPSRPSRWSHSSTSSRMRRGWILSNFGGACCPWAHVRAACSIADTRLRAPVGLDLGAETPAEVALAITAEIQAAIANAETGASLTGRPGPIHLDRA